jgi:hypothetical protein
VVHAANGFFMNWNLVPEKGEGWGYLISQFGLALIGLKAGGGKASVDAALTNKPVVRS